MTLIERLVQFEKAEKSTPRLKEVTGQLRDVLARICIIEHAIDQFRQKLTPVIQFPFEEVQVTTDLMDTLITTALANIEVPYAFITEVRSVQVRLKGARLIRDLFDSRTRRSEATRNIFDPGARPRKVYQIIQGDSLRGIAVRFLQDGSRWPEIASLNELDYPYIVDAAADVPAGKNVLLPGDQIALPLDADLSRSDVVRTSPISLAAVLGRDIHLSHGGRLTWEDAGELKAVEGNVNLEQALRNRLLTRRGELPLHPRYGSDLKDHLGDEGTPTRVALTGLEVHRSILEDPRMTRVEDIATAFDRTILDVRFTGFVIGQDEPVAANLVIPL